jgi:hypothetical protein
VMPAVEAERNKNYEQQEIANNTSQTQNCASTKPKRLYMPT